MFEEIFGFVLPFLDSVPAVRGILGFVMVLLLPGFAWTLVFFSGRQINMLERLALSVGLSIATVTLGILVLNKLFGINITGTNAVLTIFAMTITPIIWYYIKRIIGKQKGHSA